MDFKNGQVRDIGHKNCSSQTSSTNTKLVQYGQKLFHGNGHKLILESHDESTRNAFIYIGLILIIYIMAVIAIGIRYLFVRSNRNSSPFTPPNQSSNTRRNTGFTTGTTTCGTIVASPHIVTIENTANNLEIGLKETEL